MRICEGEQPEADTSHGKKTSAFVGGEVLNYNYSSAALFKPKYACHWSGLHRIFSVQFSFAAIQDVRIESVFSNGIVFISLTSPLSSLTFPVFFTFQCIGSCL